MPNIYKLYRKFTYKLIEDKTSPKTVYRIKSKGRHLAAQSRSGVSNTTKQVQDTARAGRRLALALACS